MLVVLIGSGIYPSNKSGYFAIYLLRNDTLKTWEVTAWPLDSLPLAKMPLLGTDDITSFNWVKQEIVLTPKAIERIRSMIVTRNSSLPFPFVVVVNKDRIYMGNIYQNFSSYMAGEIPYIDLSGFQLGRSTLPKSITITVLLIEPSLTSGNMLAYCKRFREKTR